MKLLNCLLTPLLLTTLLSCGKNNSVETPKVFFNEAGQKEEVLDNTENSSDEEKTDNSKELPRLPQISIHLSKIRTKSNFSLSFSQNESVLKKIKKKIFENEDISNLNLEILSHGLIYNNNKELEIESHFKEFNDTELIMNLSLKTTSIINIKNIVLEIYEYTDNAINLIDIKTVSNLNKHELTMKLSKKILTNLLRNKSNIGFRIKEFEVFQNGQIFSSLELKQEDQVFIIDQSVVVSKSLSENHFDNLKSNGISYIRNNQGISMVNNIFSTISELDPNMDSSSTIFGQGKWIKKDNIFSYIRNSDLKNIQYHYYKVNTEHITYQQDYKSKPETLTYLHLIDMANIHLGPIFKSHININGFNCNQQFENNWWCENSNYSLKLEKRQCVIKRGHANQIRQTGLNMSLFSFDEKLASKYFIKNNTLFIKSNSPIKFNKRSLKKVKINTNFVSNSCGTYKECKKRQGNCYLPHDMQKKVQDFKEIITLDVKEK